MSSVPLNHEALSLKLSEVLEEIGLNDEMVMKRRTSTLFGESVFALGHLINSVIYYKMYYFGSQSEGSTTLGIDSDDDLLICQNTHNVIHDWADWKYGVTNLLMVKDESTTPGYCFLQLLREDEPRAATFVQPLGAYYKDAQGRVLLKNTTFRILYDGMGLVQHGPAVMPPDRQGVRETDIVLAFHCESWPREGRRWLNRRSMSGWPTAQLKLKSKDSGCFVVPVSSKISPGLEELEWRISTSLAERYLVFSFSTIHMKCYILLKMLLKSYDAFKEVISSYMCKTALFHCIENTNPEFWQDQNLLLCLNQILQVLYNFVDYNNCPHFIIPENNLIAGRISAEQRHDLLEIIRHIIGSNGTVFFDIQLDNVGKRLNMKMNPIMPFPRHILSPVEVRQRLAGLFCYHAPSSVYDFFTAVLKRLNNNNVQDVVQTLQCYIARVCQHNIQYNCIEQAATSYVMPLLCSTIGSVIASYNTTINIPLSNIALECLKLGVNSDVSSGCLKLATVYYSVGDVNVTEAILRHVEQRYDRNVVMPVCACHHDVMLNTKPGFRIAAVQTDVCDFRHIVAYCVLFMRHEVHIVPQELRLEYCRSTQEDIQYRHILGHWMDLAVVDSLPYLYFLQSKTYGRLQNRREQLNALHKLQQVTFDEPTLRHRETALNLLGQCMEQENLPNDAFICYERSLQIRPRNNAANFHMSRLLAN